MAKTIIIHGAYGHPGENWFFLNNRGPALIGPIYAMADLPINQQEMYIKSYAELGSRTAKT